MLVYIKPLSLFPKLHSDTLFGAILYSISELYPDKVDELLDSFRNGEPPFVLTSTFPFIYSQDEKVRFYPKLILNNKKSNEIKNRDVLKEFKKIEYFEEEIFFKLINAEISENPLVSDSTENQNIPEVVSSFNANNLGVNMSEQEGQIAKTGDVTVYVENATVISAKDFSEKSEKTLQPSENVQVESKIVPEKKEVVERKVVAKSNPVQEKKVLLPKKSESVSKAPVKSVSEKKTVSETRKSTQYWIQVASLTSRKNADSARAVLGENKITADVFTYKDTSDKLYYRVRVGPYTTKSEAEYWRGEIAKIDSFASSQSYVTSTVVE